MEGRTAIVFYSKRGCLLCDEVREWLEGLDREFPLVIQEIDIAGDLSLYHRYQDIIPVVVIDGDLTLEGRIKEEDIRTYLLRGNLTKMSIANDRRETRKCKG